MTDWSAPFPCGLRHLSTGTTGDGSQTPHIAEARTASQGRVERRLEAFCHDLASEHCLEKIDVGVGYKCNLSDIQWQMVPV